MSWEDSLNWWDDFRKTAGTGSRPTTPAVTSPGLTKLTPDWGVKGLSSGGSSRVTAPTAAPAAPPEKFDFSLPFSTNPTGQTWATKQPTSTDLIQSLQGAVDDLIGGGSNLNIGNFMARFQETSAVMAHELGNAIGGLPGEIVGNVAGGALDVYNAGMKALSDAIGPVISWFPDMMRDQSLRERAAVARSIVSGQPIQNAGMITGSFFDPTVIGTQDSRVGMVGGGARGVYSKLEELRSIGRAAIGSDDAAFLMHLLDLPESVKDAIAKKPNISDAEIEKLLASAPEGKRFSYAEGLGGMASELINGGVYWTASLLGLGRVGELGKAVGGAFTAGLAGPEGASAIGSGLAQGVRLAAKIQTGMAAAGASELGLTTVANAIARSQGNQAVIDFANRIYSTHPISDDPQVQLITSFSIPVGPALSMAKKGILHIPSVGDAIVGKALGKGYVRLVTSEDFLYRTLAKMYGVSIETAKDLGARFYQGNKGVIADHLVEIGLEDVLAGLPEAEQAVLRGSTADAIVRGKVALERYGSQVWDVLSKTPERLANRLQKIAWEYHQYRGAFDPEVAARNAMDYRGVKLATFKARQELNAIVGYVEFIAPEAAADIRSTLEAYAMDAPIPDRVINDLIEKYPAFRKVAGNEVKPGELLTRNDLEPGIQQGVDLYETVARENPVRARSGVDPVIRPNATPAEWAEALGTTPEVFDAYMNAPGTVETANLLRPFLREKVRLSDAEIAAMDNFKVWQAADEYIARVSYAWQELGRKVAAAEKKMTEIHARIEKLRQMERSGADFDKEELAALERQYSELGIITTLATDPIRPYVEQVNYATRDLSRTAKRRYLEKQAERKVAAMAILEEIDAIDAVWASINRQDARPWWEYVGRTLDGGYAWSGGAPQITRAVADKLIEFLMAKGGKNVATAQSFHEFGMEDVWYEVARNYKPGNNFYNSLNAQQRRHVENVVGSSGAFKRSLDDFVAWSGKSEGEFLAQMIGWRQRYDELLSNTNLTRVRATANLKVPADIVEAVRNGYNAFVHDPIFEAITHPENIGKLKLALDSETYDAIIPILDADPILFAEAKAIADREGISVAELLDPPSAVADEYRRLLRELVPEDFDPAAGIGNRPRTPLDQAILGGDHPEVERLLREEQASRDAYAQGEPQTVGPDEANAAMHPKGPGRASRQYERELDTYSVDREQMPDPTIWNAQENQTGRKVLNILNWGDSARDVKTVGQMVNLLESIENGYAQRLGISAELLAEAQRVANEVLDNAIGAAKRGPFAPGIMGPGVTVRGLGADAWEFAKDLFEAGNVIHDPENPMGLQYGFKKAPNKSITFEFEAARAMAEQSGVPGLAEELISKRFKTFEERVGEAMARQAYNYVFGPLHSVDIAAKAERIFTERAMALGVSQEDAAAVWKAWRQASRESRQDQIIRIARGKGEKPRITTEKGDNPLYASPRNIPNATLEEIARSVISKPYDTVEFSRLFREASSWTLRNLQDKVPFGQYLAAVYGKATTNTAVVWGYSFFRFGMDLRFHALNLFEPFFLHMGRAGLVFGADTKPLLGMTEETLTRLSREALSDTGYGISQARIRHAYRVFQKEQRPTLLRELKGIQAEDPELMKDALLDLAKFDPELSNTIKAMGHTPEQWLEALNKWHEKLLSSMDPDAVIADEFAAAVADSPALNEVFGELAKKNQELWKDVRDTFYGRGDRSRAERILNHPLLYWPLSYQIKSTKWLLRVLFDRAGGLPTNAGGAYALNRIMAEHNRAIQTDPEYQDWLAKHKTVLFMAQMLLPMSWDSMGVTLSPPLRNLFFERSKQIFDIGPVMTWTSLAPRLVGELYPSVYSVPGASWAYRSLVGRDAPKQYEAPPIELDPTRGTKG